MKNVEKIIIHAGVASKNFDKLFVKNVFNSINFISGQKPIFSKIKKPISNFKSKKNDIAGVYVTLRKSNLINFYEKLIYVVLPNIKEFKGISSKSIDRYGNLNFSVKDCSYFPDYFDSTIFGLNINIILKKIKINFIDFYKKINFPII